MCNATGGNVRPSASWGLWKMYTLCLCWFENPYMGFVRQSCLNGKCRFDVSVLIRIQPKVILHVDPASSQMLSCLSHMILSAWQHPKLKQTSLRTGAASARAWGGDWMPCCGYSAQCMCFTLTDRNKRISWTDSRAERRVNKLQPRNRLTNEFYTQAYRRLGRAGRCV